MIYNYRYKTLKQKSESIIFPDDSLNNVIKNLWQELEKCKNGIGLAANQIGVLKRVGVIKYPTYKINVNNEEIEVLGQEIILINPEILEKKDECEISEGCLSYQGIYANIKRFRHIKVKNYTVDGNEEIFDASYMLAQAIQHEIEHMEGKTFIDNFSKAQKIIYENRIRRIK